MVGQLVSWDLLGAGQEYCHCQFQVCTWFCAVRVGGSGCNTFVDFVMHCAVESHYSLCPGHRWNHSSMRGKFGTFSSCVASRSRESWYVGGCCKYSCFHGAALWKQRLDWCTALGCLWEHWLQLLDIIPTCAAWSGGGIWESIGCGDVSDQYDSESSSL